MNNSKNQDSPALHKRDITYIIAPIGTSETQAIRLYILSVLKRLPSCSTIEFKRLGVHALAPRIWDLRHKFGYEIDSIPVDEFDDAGVLHKGIARYVLKSSTQ